MLLFKIEIRLGKIHIQSYQHNLLFLLYLVSKVWHYKIFIENLSRANKECHKTSDPGSGMKGVGFGDWGTKMTDSIKLQ